MQHSTFRQPLPDTAAAHVEGLRRRPRSRADAVRAGRTGAGGQPVRDGRRHGALHDRPPARGAHGAGRILSRKPPSRCTSTALTILPRLNRMAARLLRDQLQRPPRHRPWRRHAVVPQLAAPVPGRRRRPVRVDQQRRQGRRGRAASARALFEQFADRYFPAPPADGQVDAADRRRACAHDRRPLDNSRRVGIELPQPAEPRRRQ